MPRLYNTLTRHIEEIKPLNDKAIKIYFCGPTVYDFAHIGNFRSYVFSDLLRRYLEHKGFTVKLVMNITDVDDKTIKNSQKEKMSLNEFTRKYTKHFFSDMEMLRIKPADVYPKATEHIEEMAEIIRTLISKGMAYKGDDGSVYFDISKFKDYGKLSRIERKSLMTGARVKQDEYSKDEAHDFALWKAWSKEDGNVFWEPKGLPKGRPGWHIECSAMSKKHLGETFDIHGGGVDLIFPHHENEIAQSEGSSGKLFVKHWVHCDHLHVEGRKMSKSLGNFYTLRDLLSKGYDPLSIRYLLISSHYRSQLNFTFKELESSKNTVNNINSFFERLSSKGQGKNPELARFIEEKAALFEKKMDDDLNVPMALAEAFAMMSEMNKAIDSGKADEHSLKLAREFMHIFNELFDLLREKKDLTEDEKSLIDEREKARNKGDFKTADKIREKLRKMGITIEDTPNGVRWNKSEEERK